MRLASLKSSESNRRQFVLSFGSVYVFLAILSQKSSFTQRRGKQLLRRKTAKESRNKDMKCQIAR